MFDLQLDFGSHKTRVAVRPGVRHEIGRLLRECVSHPDKTRVVVVTDRTVATHYAADVADSLNSVGFEPLEHQIEPGETSKSLHVAGEVYEFLAEQRVGRDAIVLALGGGVVSDLAGFVAATWMRGVRFVIVPTTLESDVDASIGGKTAVNVPAAKNLVGAFHQPILVATDPECLKTLDARDVRAGMAESIKHALITSEEFLRWHEENVEAVLALEPAIMTELILRNVRIKAGVVEKDALERTGLRMILNFGHSIGHAIESRSRYSLRHGECVSLGMLAACRLSHALGLLDADVAGRTESLLSRFGLLTVLPERIDTDDVLATMQSDKKVCGGALNFVLLEGIGRPVTRDDVPENLVRRAYESLLP